MTMVIIAIAIGVFMAMGLLTLLDRTPNYVLTLIIVALGLYLFGSMAVDLFVK